MGLTLGKIKDELWSLIFTPPIEVDWSVISVMVGMRWLLRLSLEVWWHILTPYGVFRDEGMTLLNSCQVLKSWPIVWVLIFIILTNNSTQLCRFLALQAHVEHLGICWIRLGLNVPIWLNWVRCRPGIWDGGATSSKESWTCDRSPTWGCLGLAPIRWSKQWGIEILPIFLLRFGSNIQMCMASFASCVIWEGSLSIMLKFETDGRGWWKSVQCLSMAEVEDLQCSFTHSPRAQRI